MSDKLTKRQVRELLLKALNWLDDAKEYEVRLSQGLTEEPSEDGIWQSMRPTGEKVLYFRFWNR
ncbi:hypothetical protein H1164_03510 [Thermoactinomyces daqus]|uniref:Uncharacterized protein n=1 Tax=Thermoactinomyces daqus TaxID=1329516 RepID=A0A7W1X8E5_9BACL|nr:hypothetical protein [Thermoactinomyces daqus]MBA4541970.1 hypothetical protein [Thermoactinomyces daqus]